MATQGRPLNEGGFWGKTRQYPILAAGRMAAVAALRPLPAPPLTPGCNPGRAGVVFRFVAVLPGEDMNTVYARHENRDSQNWIATAGRSALRVAWHTIRLPILTLLVLMEPLVCWLLSLAAILGVLTALFWEFFSPKPHFPFWTVLAVSVGIGMLQIPYYLLIRLFSTR